MSQVTKQLKKVPINSIFEYERNNKIHADLDIDAIAASIKKNTYITPIMVDENGIILSGHGRKKALEKLNIEEAEILIVTGLTEEQKMDFRIRDNKTSEYSKRNMENLSEELNLIKDNELFDMFDIKPEPVPEIPETPLEQILLETEGATEDEVQMPVGPRASIYYYNENVVFDGNNKYNIPNIYEHMLYDGELPTYTVNAAKRIDERMCLVLYNHISAMAMEGKIVGFFSDDYRFEVVRKNSVKCLATLNQHRPQALMSPNFSMRYNEPLPYQIMARYKTQRCARFRWEDGHKIIPTINFGQDNSFDFCFLGLPKSIPISTVQVRNMKSDDDRALFRRGIKALTERVELGTVIVYGKTKSEEVLDAFRSASENIKVHFLDTRQQRKTDGWTAIT